MARVDRIVFLTGGRDFHALHWYDAITTKYRDLRTLVLLDSVLDEGGVNYFESVLYNKLFCIDRFLMSKPSKFADIWRNVVKLTFVLIQSILLAVKIKKDDLVWCHGIYYAVVCRIAGVNYAVTPQGSELLVRPNNKAYLMFLKFALRKASIITVDSRSMLDKLDFYGFNAELVYNGVNPPADYGFSKLKGSILSSRGVAPLYRISEILNAFKRLEKGYSLSICYPFLQSDYYEKIIDQCGARVNDLGKLHAPEYNRLLREIEIVVSIPYSDSSPKSMYEAIFHSCKIITDINSSWIDECTSDMKTRLILVDIDHKEWLKDALAKAVNMPDHYQPSTQSIDRFSRDKNIDKMINLFTK